MKVKNMEGRSGRPVPNQIEIKDGTRRIFQNYDSTIAITEGGKVILDRNKWDYSRTTCRYLAQFLGSPMAEIRKKIHSGEISFADLNRE